MQVEDRVITVIDGYCYECIGIRMIPTIVFDFNDNLVSGRKWLEDILASGKSMELSKIVVAEFIEYGIKVAKLTPAAMRRL